MRARRATAEAPRPRGARGARARSARRRGGAPSRRGPRGGDPSSLWARATLRPDVVAWAFALVAFEERRSGRVSPEPHRWFHAGTFAQAYGSVFSSYMITISARRSWALRGGRRVEARGVWRADGRDVVLRPDVGALPDVFRRARDGSVRARRRGDTLVVPTSMRGLPPFPFARARRQQV